MNKILLLIPLLTCLKLNAQLQNPDFEVCDTSVEQHISGHSCRYIEGWKLGGTDPTSGFHAQNGGVMNAQSGNMALQLSVWYTYNKDEAYQHIPFTTFPESLSGYYTYTDNVVGSTQQQISGPDSASVTVLLSKWNSLSGQRDTIGFGKLYLGEATGYTAFLCPIHYVSAMAPDSLLVHLDCSRVDAGSVIGSMWGNSSVFTVDNLSLNSGTMGLDAKTATQNWLISPNPGNGIVEIRNFSGTVEVWNLNGKCLLSQSYDMSGLDVGFLPDGLYMFRLTDQLNRTNTLKYLKH